MRLYIVAVPAVVILIAACAMQKTPADPARIEQEIAASKIEELALVRETIREPSRAESFIDLLAEREQLLERFTQQIADHRKQMAQLNTDYEAERADFDALIADYNRNRIAAQQRLVDLLAEMKQVTTTDEWDAISTFQLDRLDLRKLAYQASTGGS